MDPKKAIKSGQAPKVKLFLGGIPENTSADDIRSVFSVFGLIPVSPLIVCVCGRGLILCSWRELNSSMIKRAESVEVSKKCQPHEFVCIHFHRIWVLDL